MKKLGLVGGISWVSTIDYYRLINEGINKHLGGLNFAECIIYSLNFGEIQKATWENSFDLLHSACLSLKKSGAEGIVLCANTAHLMIERLEKETRLPFIHIATATAERVLAAKIRKVALLGTKFTMEMDFYKGKLQEFGIDTIIPGKQETRDYIQHTLKEELGRGIMIEDTRQNYLSIIQTLIEDGAEGVILGCTEIPMIISQNDFKIPIFDTTKIHAEAAVAFSISSNQ